MEQSVEWWHALKAMKVPTKLVVYPNEGHMFIKPADSRDYPSALWNGSTNGSESCREKRSSAHELLTVMRL